MASFNDLAYDWSTLCQECPECWTTSDLQLAAELGKTLLERNKELEIALRQHQNVIEDQTQEIEYLTKQTAALREVNDSRLRIYEQLEVSIQDLERANHRLAVDNTADKKQIKNLTSNIESLETRCEDLHKTIDDLKAQLDIAKRKAERKPEKPKETQDANLSAETPTKKIQNDLENIRFSTPIKTLVPPALEFTKEHEDLLRLSDDLRETKVALSQEQRRVTELEEQLASLVQENNRLQDQLRNGQRNYEEPKSMQEEFSILEEVRQGQLCLRCLRGVERAPDEMSSVLDGDDDDRSAISSLLMMGAPGDNSIQVAKTQQHEKICKFETDKEKILQSLWSSNEENPNNPYRELVEKYEALLQVQLSQVNNIRKSKQPTTQQTPGPISLQEELQTSGDYSQFSMKDTDEESGHQEDQNKKPTATRKKFRQTPDFSEAETSSSGFSDETSNKATQTEKERPGSFLCTIADGEDLRFSIYEDANPMDSRFRNRPEYRELFKEIFTILKKAAENKDDGEKLPLLDDSVPAGIKVPPVTPANEEGPGFMTDDTQSVMSSVLSDQSIAISDVTTSDINATLKQNESVENKTELIEKDKENKENKPQEKPAEKQVEKNAQPIVRQPLDYISATKKKTRHRRKHSQDRQGAESPIFPSPPKITYQRSNKKRRDFRPLEPSPLVKTPQETASDWNGATLMFYNSSVNSPTPSSSSRSGKIYQSWNPETDSWNVKQCTASQEIHKLRKLELSYAEVLRNADKSKGRRKKHQ